MTRRSAVKRVSLAAERSPSWLWLKHGDMSWKPNNTNNQYPLPIDCNWIQGPKHSKTVILSRWCLFQWLDISQRS